MTREAGELWIPPTTSGILVGIGGAERHDLAIRDLHAAAATSRKIAQNFHLKPARR
jgi:hypothetical protein